MSAPEVARRTLRDEAKWLRWYATKVVAERMDPQALTACALHLETLADTLAALGERPSPPLRDRDALWCQAILATLDTREAEKVTAWFNAHRPDAAGEVGERPETAPAPTGEALFLALARRLVARIMEADAGVAQGEEADVDLRLHAIISERDALKALAAPPAGERERLAKLLIGNASYFRSAIPKGNVRPAIVGVLTEALERAATDSEEAASLLRAAPRATVETEK